MVNSLALIAVLLIAVVPAATVSAQGGTCQGEPATIVGTTGDDRLVGTDGDDVIVALGGDDVISGRQGNDLICAGWGADTITGGTGDDRIFAGPGSDHVTGGDGDDHLAGGPGRDTLIGNVGADTLAGGQRADSLQGGLGEDTLKGGAGPDRLVGGEGADALDGGAGRDTCAITTDPTVRCERATAATSAESVVETPPVTTAPGSDPESTPVSPIPEGMQVPLTVERVIHISIDGLRSDYVDSNFTPTLAEMQRSGTSTLNARNDPDWSNTLPNHTSQLTGRSVEGDAGHGVDFNEDNGGTVHDEAGEYVASVFDVAHDHGLVTAAYVGKEKFYVHERSWDAENGRADDIGANDGRAKLDLFVRDSPEDNVENLIEDLDETALGRDDAYIFFHIRLPDSAGHNDTWGSSEYGDAVRESDDLVRQIRDHIESNDAWSSTTAMIVTSDHGGPDGETSHFDITDSQNYTIPFIVDTPDAKPASDLYILNPATRRDPGTGTPRLGGVQPIRGHEAGNLSLSLLGLPPIPDSTFNALHDLQLN